MSRLLTQDGRSWTPLLLDLIELDEAGALGGIRAVIAERLRHVREGLPVNDDDPHYLLHLVQGSCRSVIEYGGHPGEDRKILAEAAALLAAEIDRQQQDRSGAVS